MLINTVCNIVQQEWFSLQGYVVLQVEESQVDDMAALPARIIDRGRPVTINPTKQNDSLNDYKSTHIDALPYTMYITLYMSTHCVPQ